MFGVTSAINVAAMGRTTHKIQSPQTHIYIHTHTHSQDTTDTHNETTPLSDRLSPSSLVSLSVSLAQAQPGYNGSV